mmetsp:Transcript_57928/g.125809  ORF Transcript_57928/g.125809 Transcript_57928/m.125809 type:complete len:337 (-) Transcript_57928:516-1526(-)
MISCAGLADACDGRAHVDKRTSRLMYIQGKTGQSLRYFRIDCAHPSCNLQLIFVLCHKIVDPGCSQLITRNCLVKYTLFAAQPRLRQPMPYFFMHAQIVYLATILRSGDREQRYAPAMPHAFRTSAGVHPPIRISPDLERRVGLPRLRLVLLKELAQRSNVLAVPLVHLLLGRFGDDRELQRLANVGVHLGVFAREERHQRLSEKGNPWNGKGVEPQAEGEKTREGRVRVALSEGVDGLQLVPELECILDEPLSRRQKGPILPLAEERRVLEPPRDDREGALLTHVPCEDLPGRRVEPARDVAQDLKEEAPLPQVARDEEDSVVPLLRVDQLVKVR